MREREGVTARDMVSERQNSKQESTAEVSADRYVCPHVCERERE